MARPKRAAQPNTATAAEGHNGLSPDRQVELTLEARRMKRALDEASGKYRAVLAKLSDGGVDMKAWRQVEKLSQLDPEEREMQLRNVARYAGFLDLPLGTQVSAFSDDTAKPGQKTKSTIAEFQVEDDGYDAGRGGSARDTNPHEAGSPFHVLWDKGHRAGEAAAVEAMKTGEKKTRGRQKASANPEDRTAP